MCIRDSAEHGALRAAGGLHFLLELLFVIGLALGAHHYNAKLLVVIDASDYVVGEQHVLVEQIADRQIVRVIADGHGGDDFLRVEKNRQRPLYRDRGLDLGPGLVDAGDALGQPRVLRVGPDDVAVVILCHNSIIAENSRHAACCPPWWATAQFLPSERPEWRSSVPVALAPVLR